MNSTAAPAPETKTIARRILSKKFAARFLFVCALVITLLALGVAFENYRGKKAWEGYVRASLARGERFDSSALRQPSVPDDQNFFKAPIFAGTFNLKMDRHTGTLVPLDPAIHDQLTLTAYHAHSPAKVIPSLGNWSVGKSADLAAWRKYSESTNTAHASQPDPSQAENALRENSEAILSDLAAFDSQRIEILEAAKRPEAQIPLSGEEAFTRASVILNPMVKFRSVAQYLSLHASASLGAGHRVEAFEDQKILFRLVAALQTDPLLISQMVRIALLQQSLQPLWEGMVRHRWTSAQLESVEHDLAPMDLLRDYATTIRFERAFSLWMMDGSFGNPRQTYFPVLAPRGWLYQNRISLCRMSQDYLLPMVDVERRIISPQAVAKNEAAFKRSHSHLTPYDLFTLNLFPALSRIPFAFARAQASVDLARVSCALERYFLKEQHYPASLKELMPQFIGSLPNDVITGQPLRYRVNSDGRFVLYSVGWDTIDNGGTVELEKDGSQNRNRGDWVWKLPESSAL